MSRGSKRNFLMWKTSSIWEVYSEMKQNFYIVWNLKTEGSVTGLEKVNVWLHRFCRCGVGKCRELSRGVPAACTWLLCFLESQCRGITAAPLALWAVLAQVFHVSSLLWTTEQTQLPMMCMEAGQVFSGHWQLPGGVSYLAALPW